MLFALVFVSSAQESAESGKNLFLDFDQDGLSNDEETAYGTDPYNADTDNDGYSDYVEISGGYDPRKPAPGDRVVPVPAIAQSASNEGAVSEAGENMTDEAGAKIAGVIQTSLAEGNDVTLADVDKVVQDAIAKGSESPVLPEVDMERITVKKQAYKDLSDDEKKEQIKEDAQEYITAVSYIFAVQFPQIKSESDTEPTLGMESMLSGLMSSVTSGNYAQLEEFSTAGESVVNQLFEVEVPETLLDVHIHAIQLANYAQEIKDNVKVDTSDPLASISNLSLVQGLLVMSQEFFTDAQKRLVDLGVDNAILDSSN